MRRAETVLAVLLALLAAGIAREGWALRYYTPLGPGPGFFPLWLGGILAVLALLLVVQARRASPDLPSGFCPTRAAAWRLCSVVAGLVGCFLAIETLGFATTLSAFVMLVMVAIGSVAWLLALAVALLGSFGVTQIFRGLLHISLPVGPFGL